jgi:hypothetical protein
VSSPGQRERRSPEPGVFISYRRSETSGYAGRLYDALAEHFGAERVFMDVTMEAGIDYTVVIGDAIGSCGAVIALIGGQWLTVTDERGNRRIDDPADLHRVEIESALDRGVRVFPALVQGARMPTVEELPEPLRPLARRQAVELSDGRWDFDVSRLTHVLERVLGTEGPGEGIVARARRRVRRAIAGVRRAAMAHPWRVAYPLGLATAGLAALAVLAAIAAFSASDLPQIGALNYHRPPGSRIATCNLAVTTPRYAIEGVDWLIRGSQLDHQQDPPWECGNFGKNTWDTCFSHSRAQRVPPGDNQLTAVVTDKGDHTVRKTFTVQTACPKTKK